MPKRQKTSSQKQTSKQGENKLPLLVLLGQLFGSSDTYSLEAGTSTTQQKKWQGGCVGGLLGLPPSPCPTHSTAPVRWTGCDRQYLGAASPVIGILPDYFFPSGLHFPEAPGRHRARLALTSTLLPPRPGGPPLFIAAPSVAWQPAGQSGLPRGLGRRCKGSERPRD